MTPRAVALAVGAVVAPLLASLVVEPKATTPSTPSLSKDPRTPSRTSPSPSRTPTPAPSAAAGGKTPKPTAAPATATTSATPRTTPRPPTEAERINKILKIARKQIGTSGRPNTYTRWYSNELGKGSAFLYSDWCAIFLVWVAEEAGERKHIGTDAYTPTWAEWYARKGRWGTEPRVGAIVFFDWAGGKSRAGIDHVGIVEKVNGNGTITTIEGNADNQVQRRSRSFGIVGYGYWA